MASEIYGTLIDPARQHPVLDLTFWENQFPRAEGDCTEDHPIDTPGKLARREQAIRRVTSDRKLGEGYYSDVFVWSHRWRKDKPWLTKIGGRPWRAAGKPWPRDKDGVPLAFLGQICFLDSKDLFDFELPGDVALIFGTARPGWITLHDGSALEWSSLDIKPSDGVTDIPWNGRLPYEYHGVLHRSVQYLDQEKAERAFRKHGFEEGGWQTHHFQATCIGPYASIPQGWPFYREDDDRQLVAILSSFYFRGRWPLCDVRGPMRYVWGEGDEAEVFADSGRDFGIEDAGCVWIYREPSGEFKLSSSCG